MRLLMQNYVAQRTTYSTPAVSASFDKILNYFFVDSLINLTDDAPDFIFQLSSCIGLVGIDLGFKTSPQKEDAGI